jgi:structural maintenance of chromosome 1
LKSVKEDLKRVNGEIKEISQKADHVSSCVKRLTRRSCLYIPLQISTADEETLAKISQLREVIDAVDDQVFKLFCPRIGVSNIREYEDKQLKLAQDQGETRLKFETQLAKLKNQYVADCFQPNSVI